MQNTQISRETSASDLGEPPWDEDASFEVRITDFGMARMQAADVELTRTGTILGTPAYMAPEQSRGARVDVGPPADVYGLGGLLYEMIARRPPFEADNVVDMLQAVRNKAPQAPSKINPEVPRDLETLTLRCLDKDPSTRLPSAGFLADELRRFLDGKPILSVPNSMPTAITKWARRHPAIASLAAALIVVAMFGTMGIVWQWQNAERALAAVTRIEREKSLLLSEAEAALYQQHIDRIDSELNAGNFAQATRLLANCAVNQRGWEWNYLRRTSMRYDQHFSDFRLFPAAFDLNPDKTTMLAVETRANRPELGGRWCLWDLASGRLLREHESLTGGSTVVRLVPAVRRSRHALNCRKVKRRTRWFFGMRSRAKPCGGQAYFHRNRRRVFSRWTSAGDCGR